MTIPKNNKKILAPVIAIVILALLVIGVSSAFAFIKDVFQGVAGDATGAQGGAMKFELQKARDLGVIVQQ